MDIGAYVALVALILGTPYMVYKKQWFLASYFLLNAVAILSITLLEAPDMANTLTWASLVLLALGIYQLLRQTKAPRSVS